MADLAELIARLEKADGADRELDALLAVALDARLAVSNCGFPGFVHLPESQFDVSAREYTASIDAALMLVPEGKNWCIHTEPKGYYAYVVLVYCAEPHSDGPADWQVKHEGGQTIDGPPAIALCIAALRARAALTAQKVDP